MDARRRAGESRGAPGGRPAPGPPRAGAAASEVDPPTSRGEEVFNSLGFLVGLAIMTGDYALELLGRGPRDDPSWRFLQEPRALTWILFVAAQFAFWVHALGPLRRRVRRLRRDLGLAFTPQMKVDGAFTIIYFLLPIAFLTRVVPDSNLKHHDSKIFVVNSAGLAVAMVAVVGIWYVRAALQAGEGAGGGPGDWRVQLGRLVRLRRDLRAFMAFLGAMVTMSTLAKGALRQAILATGSPADVARFPAEFVLLQGAFFTGLLALVYLPTHDRYLAVGNHLVDSVLPLDAPGVELKDLGERQAGRRRLEDLLRLRSRGLDDLRAVVTILAPLGTGVVAVWLGTKA